MLMKAVVSLADLPMVLVQAGWPSGPQGCGSSLHSSTSRQLRASPLSA